MGLLGRALQMLLFMLLNTYPAVKYLSIIHSGLKRCTNAVRRSRDKPEGYIIDEILLYKIKNRMELLIKFLKDSCAIKDINTEPSNIYPRQGIKTKPKYFKRNV